MAMNGFVAIATVFVVFAIGDFISAKTRAMCSMIFVSAVLFLVGFQTGLFPQDMFAVSALLPAGGVLIALVITHMGSLMNVREFIAQWRTVVIGVASMAGIGIILMFVGPLFMDRVSAIAAAPAIAGGVVAAIVMGEAGAEIGLPMIAVFTALIVAFQGFIGFPITSICLRKEAARLKKSYAAGETITPVVKADGPERKKLIPPLPESIRNSTNTLFAKLAIVAALSIFIADATGGVVHRFVVCLILGVAFKELGFLEDNIMTKSNAFGYAMGTILVIIFASLATVSLEELLAMAGPIAIAFGLSLFGIFGASALVGKILGVSMYMAIAIGISTTVGFPGTFIISNEVARSMGESEEETQFILDSIMPRMLVAGFTTVTVGSVFMAGIMINFI